MKTDVAECVAERVSASPEPRNAHAFRCNPRSSKAWLWFVAAFLLQLGAWAAWFTIAAQHKVQEVPLATSHR